MQQSACVFATQRSPPTSMLEIHEQKRGLRKTNLGWGGKKMQNSFSNTVLFVCDHFRANFSTGIRKSNRTRQMQFFSSKRKLLRKVLLCPAGQLIKQRESESYRSRLAVQLSLVM